jgi:hypothetical protein
MALTVATLPTYRLRRRCPLLADCVEKLEKRGALKISQVLRIGDFSRCKAL